MPSHCASLDSRLAVRVPWLGRTGHKLTSHLEVLVDRVTDLLALKVLGGFVLSPPYWEMLMARNGCLITLAANAEQPATVSLGNPRVLMF